MSTKDDGGPAFPAQFFDERATGMTLRDYFAAKAMDRMIARAEMHFENNAYQEWDEFHAYVGEQAYMIADAMLKARME